MDDRLCKLESVTVQDLQGRQRKLVGPLKDRLPRVVDGAVARKPSAIACRIEEIRREIDSSCSDYDR